MLFRKSIRTILDEKTVHINGNILLYANFAAQRIASVFGSAA
jgi:hypothetical protein